MKNTRIYQIGQKYIILMLFIISILLISLKTKQKSNDHGISGIKEFQSQIPDISGSWDWEGRPVNDKDAIRNGRMDITLHQNGTSLTGDLIQINGPYGDIPENGRVAGWEAHLTGIIIPATAPKYSMVCLRRTNVENDFEAIFTGNIDDSGKRIEGYFVNNEGLGGGRFVMKKR